MRNGRNRFASAFAALTQSRAKALGTGVALAILLVGGAHSAHAQTKKDKAHIVYVESNIGAPGENSILAYQRDAAGALTPLPGSPFRTGGLGNVDLTLSVGPFDSDQDIILNEDKTRMFAVNSGSNTIAVFDVYPNGTLIPVPNSPFASGGVQPVSLGLAGNILAVVNKDQDINQPPALSIPNYTAFRVTRKGELVPIADSTVPVALGSSPSQALVSPDKRLMFGADFMGGLLQSFEITAGGRLLPNTQQALPMSEFFGLTAPHFPLGLQVHPKLPLLYVGFVTINRLGVYEYNEKGVLRFITTVPNSGKAVCWLYVNKAATRLYTSNTTDNTVSVYDLTNPYLPREIQYLALKGNGNPLQITLDENEQFFYVVDQRNSTATPLGDGSLLHVLTVDKQGLLTEVPSSPTALPVPPGTRPQGVVTLH